MKKQQRRYDSKKQEWHIPVSTISPAQLKQSLNSIAKVEFIDHLTRRRYSKSTIRNYSHHLGRYLSFMHNLDLQDRDQQIYAYINYLSDPTHPVAIAMERQKTVKEVRIIEGLDK